MRRGETTKVTKKLIHRQTGWRQTEWKEKLDEKEKKNI